MRDEFSFDRWVEYFEENSRNLLPIDWHAPYKLTATEREVIRSSIQQFQIGESSEGRHLLAKARKCVSRQEDTSYLEALTLFIKEEQRHARMLSAFMSGQSIPVIRKHWVDQAFRELRRPFDLETSVTVLITAEIIAAVYYLALKKATHSMTLHQLCDQILKDEDQHITFQSETLNKLLSRRSRLHFWMHRLGHRILLEGTLVVVWSHHKPVLLAGGYTYQSFVNECRKVFQWSDTMVRGTS